MKNRTRIGGHWWVLGLFLVPGLLPAQETALPAKTSQKATAPEVLPVWSGIAPGSENWSHREVVYRNGTKAMVRNVTTPTLTAFLPDPGVATGAAVVISPGGGFRFLSWDSEGIEVAEWLRSRGIAAFVLKYRVMKTAEKEEDFQKEMAAFFQKLARRGEDTSTTGEGGGRPKTSGTKAVLATLPEDMREIGELAIADGRQAVKVVRQNANRWNLRPDRVGLLGFSAGAVVTMGVVMDHDPESRPNFAAPIYGGGTGGNPVPKDAPPLFILCASDDHLAAAGSIQLYGEWKAAKQPVELHLYEKGGHGFGMSQRGLPIDRWVDRYGDWLGQRGLIQKMKPR